MRPSHFINFALLSVFVTASGLPDPGASPEPKIEAAVSAVRGGPAPEQCNRTVEVYEDVRSPPPVGALWGRPLTCVYRFRAFRASPKDWVLRIRFKKFKVGELLNGTTCHKGYMQIIDGNAKTDVSNRKEGGLFCGETEQPQTFISETSVVKIIFHADNYTDQTYFSFDSRAEQQFEVYLRYGQHPELYPNRRGEVVAGSYCERVFRDCRLQTCYVQSAAYPGIYPRNLHCRYHLNTRLPYIKLYIENEEFNVDGQRCENIISCPMRPITSGAENCPYDYIRIYDGKDESAEVIGTFCGMGKFPYSIIGTSQDLFVEFVSSPAGPLLNTGFHFNVGNWPGHVEAAGERVGNCDWLLTAEGLARASASEGIFLSVAHWYPPHTTCTYHMKGPPNHLVRLYFPSFRVNRIDSPIEPYSGECGESLTLYDGSYADDSKIIKTFCDTFSRPMEKHDFVSTGSDMFVRFESKTGSYSGSSLYYWAHYDFFNDTRLGERVPDTACDEIIGAWKSRSGWLRSPLNTLVYKTGGARDVHCMTRLVTDTRLYARVLLRVKSIGFKEHPYAASRCGVGAACWEERTDKLLIWEPGPTNASAHEVVRGTLGHCICSRHTPALPLHVLSAGTEVRILLIVEGTHSAASYFKQPVPLWQGEYEFVHGPLCGKAHVGGAEGALVYPALAALAYAPPPPSEHCAWDMRPEPNADLYLRFDRLHFASSRCHEAQIQVFVGGSVTPELTICGDNATLGKEVRPLSARELVLPPHALPSSAPVRIVLKSSLSPAPVAFRLVWSALYHLPRPEDAQPLIAAETETWHRGFVVAGVLLAVCVVVILFRKRSLGAPKKQIQ